MDDLSYFREEREWAAREDEKSREKKARRAGSEPGENLSDLVLTLTLFDY